MQGRGRVGEHGEQYILYKVGEVSGDGYLAESLPGGHIWLLIGSFRKDSQWERKS